MKKVIGYFCIFSLLLLPIYVEKRVECVAWNEDDQLKNFLPIKLVKSD